VVVDEVVVTRTLGTVVVELPDDMREDVEEDVKVTEGKESDVLLLGTLQNCCASDSAVVSSEGHPLEIQSTITLLKRLLRFHYEQISRKRSR